MKEFHRDFANRTGLAQAWTVKSADRLFTALPIPRDLANDILAAIPLLQNEWPLVKIDLILQNTDKYYMSWRRFLCT